MNGNLTGDQIIDYIRKSIDNDPLVVSPLLEKSQIGDVSVDLRLGQHFLVQRPSATSVIDVFDLANNLKNSSAAMDGYSVYRIPYGGYFTLHAGQTVRIGTLEYIGLPRDLMGEVKLRHSISNLPISASTAVIQPGYRGIVVMNLENHAMQPIRLYPGIKIAQLILSRLDKCVEKPKQSRYFTSVVPEPSRIDKDKEIRHLGPSADPFIIGVVSTMASGRTLVIQYLQTKYAFFVFSLVSHLKELALREGIKPERGKLQALGTKLRQLHGADYFATRLRQSRYWLENRYPFVVVDSFKTLGEVREFRKQGRFVLLGIDADFEVRQARAKSRPAPESRDYLSVFESLDRVDRGIGRDPESYGQNVSAVLGQADYVIMNNFDTKLELYEEVDRALRELGFYKYFDLSKEFEV